MTDTSSGPSHPTTLSLFLKLPKVRFQPDPLTHLVTMSLNMTVFFKASLRRKRKDFDFTQEALSIVNKTLKYFRDLPTDLVGIVDQVSLESLNLR